MSQQTGQKEFNRSIQKISSTILKLQELCNQALEDIINLSNTSKTIFIISQDDITPLVADDQELKTTGAILVHSLPKTRTKKTVDNTTKPDIPITDEIPIEGENTTDNEKS